MSNAPSGESLRQRVFRAGGWTVAGYATNQVLRFGSNLVMTRLLFPEAFGLMTIVQTVMTGVTMLSDLGIAQSIIRHARGAEPAYMNTAWTLQVGKGVIVALILWGAAGPVAAAYGQPLLEQLIPVAALIALVTGFNSTKVALANRNVDAVRVTLIDVGSLTMGIAASMLLALRDPSPWALVWGNLLGAAVKMLAGHFLLKGPTNRLAWDSSVARSILTFGAWVMLSSALTFLGGEGNKLMLAAVLDVRLLALLGLATTLNVVVWQAVRQLSGGLLFPAYSEVLRTDPKRLSGVVERARRVQIAPAWVVALIFVFAGPKIVQFLYDSRYEQAGVILQILAVGLMVDMLNGSFAGVLWAMGRTGLSTVLLVVLVVLQVAGILVGYWTYGKAGAIIGFASASWFLYPIHAVAYARLGLWHPKIDVPVLLASAATAVLLVILGDWRSMGEWQ